jgi:hypothetical protein
MTEGAAGEPSGPVGGGRTCPRCGNSVAASAAFCRSCGARYEEPPPERAAPAPPDPPPVALPPSGGEPVGAHRRPSGAILFLATAIVFAAAGITAAILLSGNGGSSTTTVVTTEADVTDSGAGAAAAAPAPTESIDAGRYVQAGSFKFLADAEKERNRLAADGIDVEVVPSEEAQELYPGFQVLLGGPLRSGSEETLMLRRLHGNGVPSAFARHLTPALPAPVYSELARRTWTGKLEESSTSRPRLDRSLPATLTMSSSGKEGTLVFLDVDCVAELAAEPSAGPTLRFGRSSGCFAGSWQLRLSEGKLILTLLPQGSDVIVLGELHPA